jgi:transposase-like protein
METPLTSPRTFGEEHFGQCPLGNRARVKRLTRVANALAEHPEGSLPDKLHDPAGYQGLMRLVKHPTVTHATVLEAHRRRTQAVAQAHEGVVLWVHDTTELDYTTRRSLTGLGQIGKGNCKGYICHNSLAVSAASGELLGLGHQILHRREDVPKGEGTKAKRERETRESLLWVKACAALGPAPPGRTWVDVADRGADTFEFLDSEVVQQRHFVVRSHHDRPITVGHGDAGVVGTLHGYARGLPVAGRRTVQIGARNGKPPRTACVAVAAAAVRVLPPRKKRGKHRGQPLLLWVVIARETDPPAGEEAVEWILLTDCRTETRAEIDVVLQWYERRWVIEDYHKAQKTGCAIEAPQFTKEERLQPVIALLSVVAVLLVNLRWQSRQPACQDKPAREVVPEVYVAVLSVWRDKERKPGWTVAEFFGALARLGGYLPRHKEGQPGWLVLWRGWRKLQDMLEYALAAGLEKSD